MDHSLRRAAGSASPQTAFGATMGSCQLRFAFHTHHNMPMDPYPEINIPGRPVLFPNTVIKAMVVPQF